MINQPKPAHTAEIIAWLVQAQSPASIEPSEIEQFIINAEFVEEHLRLVAKPLHDSSKMGSRSPSPPRYSFGPANAGKAEQALPHSRQLVTALRHCNLETALTEARAIEEIFA